MLHSARFTVTSQAAPVSFTVTFNANSASSGTAPGAMTTASGSSITLPGAGNLSRTGYTFGGWNTNNAGTGTNYSAGTSYRVNANVTLYARWTQTAQNQNPLAGTTWTQSRDGRSYTLSFARDGNAWTSVARNINGSTDRDEGSYTLRGDTLTLNFKGGYTEVYTYSQQRIVLRSDQQIVFTPQR